MSRRARNRLDKRQMYHEGGSPELERALNTLAGLPLKSPRPESEDDPITLKTGEKLDLRKPWPMPNNERTSP